MADRSKLDDPSDEDIAAVLLGTLRQLEQELGELVSLVELVDQDAEVLESEGPGSSATFLRPDEQEKARSLELASRFQDWIWRVIPFLARRSLGIEKDCLETANELMSYIMLQRIGSNISHPRWRQFYANESSALFEHLTGLIRANRDCFFSRRRASTRRSLKATLRMGVFDSSDEICRIDLTSEIGVATATAAVLDLRDVQLFCVRYCDPRLAESRGQRPSSMQPYADFGAVLFNAVFVERVRDLYFRLREEAKSSGAYVQLNVVTPRNSNLSDIPWEFMFDGTDFLALATSVSITRRSEDTPIRGAFDTDQPVRILVTVSAPDDQDEVDVAVESSIISQALAPLLRVGQVDLRFTPDGTLRSLHRALRAAESDGTGFDVWHFIGHGEILQPSGTGVLYFTSPTGGSHAVGGFDLATLVASYPSVQLAVLNACDSGRRGTSATSLNADIASFLVGAGLGAVIGMQFKISETAAHAFAEEFYSAVADGLPVELAVSEARRALFFGTHRFEWATPVTLMSTDSGRILPD